MKTEIKYSKALGMIALAGGLFVGQTASANSVAEANAAEALSASDVVAPTLREAAEYKYPRKALSKAREGWAVIEIDVDEAGEISDLEIIDSSNKRLFAQHAKAIVESSDFEPAMQDGAPISLNDYRIRVRYRLVDAEE